jgi:hypothetical protein
MRAFVEYVLWIVCTLVLLSCALVISSSNLCESSAPDDDLWVLVVNVVVSWQC